jgi:hypothetical protein
VLLSQGPAEDGGGCLNIEEEEEEEVWGLYLGSV